MEKTNNNERRKKNRILDWEMVYLRRSKVQMLRFALNARVFPGKHIEQKRRTQWHP